MLKKTLGSPLASKEIKPVNPKGNQAWIFIGRTETEAEAPIFWPPDVKSRLIRRDDAGKDWRQKRTTEDEMVGWHHRLNGHEFEQVPGDGEGQRSLGCCSSWGCKESDMIERLNNNKKLNKELQSVCVCVCVCVCIVTQLCLALCNHLDCSQSGCSVHGILQPRILEWVAYLFSREYFWPRNQTGVSGIAGGFFTSWAISHLNYQGSPWATIWPSNSIPRYILERNENICPYKDLYMNVYSSIIHNNPKVETTQMSIHGWMDKQNAVLATPWSIIQL